MTGVTARPDEQAEQEATRAPFNARNFVSKYGLLLVFIAVLAFFTAVNGRTFINVGTWSRTILSATGFTPLLILATGLTVVLAMRDFDLSFGNMVGLAGATAVALMVRFETNVVVALGVVLVIAVVVGLINGFLIAQLGASSFIITLAMGTILFGIETLWTANRSVTGVTDAFYLGLNSTSVMGQLRLPFFIALGVFALMWLVLDRTELGRYVYAVGGNPEAARFSGVPVARLRTLGFVVVALCAALVGVLLTANFGGSRSDLGTGFLLDAYAAAFLGAAVFRPGQFNVPGTLLGVLFLRVVEVGLLQMQIQNSWINIAKGGILVFGILLSQLVVKRR